MKLSAVILVLAGNNGSKSVISRMIGIIITNFIIPQIQPELTNYHSFLFQIRYFKF